MGGGGAIMGKTPFLQPCYKGRCIFVTDDIFLIGSFPFVPPPPPQYVMRPPVTEHVPLHSKSLCKNIARASGGCK